MRTIIFAFAALLPFSAYAQKVIDLPVISKAGAWELRKGVDRFSDKVRCVITLEGNLEIQSTNSSFYIVSGRGRSGLAGYQLRFNDSPPTQLKSSDKMEKDLSIIIINDNTFQNVKNSQRVRVSAVGILNGTGFQHDLNMAGYSDALARWEQVGCPRNYV